MANRPPATDGYFISDGESCVASTHGVVFLDPAYISEQADKLNFTEKDDGRVVISNRTDLTRKERAQRRRAEAKIRVHPNFGRPCHESKCSFYGSFNCPSCRLARYCSETCQKQHWYQHQQTCFTMEKVRNNLEERKFVSEIFVFFYLVVQQFYECGNTARCCF